MLNERAPAKINLTLAVIGRRADGYHELDSLVVFARDLHDDLTFTPGRALSLRVDGPTAHAAGESADNLVLKAAHALTERREGVAIGAFHLTKRIPVAAGLGGGSSDAAAALRLLARASDIALNDPVLFDAARAVGADVAVCLDPQARVMRGVGDILSPPLDLPALPLVLVHPAVACPTGAVFRELGLSPSSSNRHSGASRSDEPGTHVPPARSVRDDFAINTPMGSGLALRAPRNDAVEGPSPRSDDRALFIQWLSSRVNDLEAPAIGLVPVIADALAMLRVQSGCALARMSGSGATCFGLFDAREDLARAAESIAHARPEWRVAPTLTM
jgi:4-diphosphocytidyl-2-C-methyl-D-erythritol kinase